jgi:hypothetical protein
VPANTTVNVAAVDLDPWQLEGTNCLSDQTWNGQCINVTDQGMEIVGKEDPELPKGAGRCLPMQD